jgi:hypothetical protein
MAPQVLAQITEILMRHAETLIELHLSGISLSFYFFFESRIPSFR